MQEVYLSLYPLTTLTAVHDLTAAYTCDAGCMQNIIVIHLKHLRTFHVYVVANKFSFSVSQLCDVICLCIHILFRVFSINKNNSSYIKNKSKSTEFCTCTYLSMEGVALVNPVQSAMLLNILIKLASPDDIYQPINMPKIQLPPT